jgi:glycosyltransferase involved in cell wall biosynthesis
MLLNGGPRTQVLQTKRCLEQLGITVSLFESWKEFRRDGVDLVHLFAANIGTYHLAREIHKLGIPVIVSPIFYTRHGPGVVRAVITADRIAKGLVRGIWTDYGLIAEICSWANAVLPNTSSEAALFKQGFGVEDDRITVVPNGVEERFAMATPDAFVNKYGVHDFILNAGHVGPARKNVLRLIRALSTIDHPAVIIGRYDDSGEGRMCLDEAQRNPRLLMLESLPNDSELLASAYAACDVFALPSLFETPGIAALEAGLAGAKIVITGVGGTRDYFREDADYVDPGSVDSIRDGILKGLSRKKTPTLRDRIRREYLWEQVAGRTLEVYRRVLGT